MPTPEDGLAYFAAAGLLVAYAAICIALGAAPGNRGLIRRREQPAVFWPVMAIAGFGALAFLYMGLLAVTPWPPAR
jgi:hypothetical protein